MSLTKKRKQLIAASLAAMTAFGATVPAIVASAPAAFAAVDKATLATSLTGVVLGTSTYQNLFETDESNLTTGTLVLTPGSDLTAQGSTAFDATFFRGAGTDGLADKLSAFITQEIGASSFTGTGDVTLTVEQDSDGPGSSVNLTNDGSGATAVDADTLDDSLLTAFQNAVGGTDTYNDLLDHTYTLTISQTSGPSVELTLQFKSAETVLSEKLESAVTSTLTEENLAKLLVADYVSASSDGSVGSQGDPYALTAGTNFTTSNGSTPLTGLVADTDASSLADALYDWANTATTDFTGKTVQLVVDTDPVGTAPTVDLISGGTAVAANTIADRLETALTTLGITDLSTLAEKTLSFTLKTSDDLSNASTTRYVTFPALTDDSAPVDITYTLTPADGEALPETDTNKFNVSKAGSGDSVYTFTGTGASVDGFAIEDVTSSEGGNAAVNTDYTVDTGAKTVTIKEGATTDSTIKIKVTSTANSTGEIVTLTIKDYVAPAETAFTYKVDNGSPVNVTTDDQATPVAIPVNVDQTITLAGEGITNVQIGAGSEDYVSLDTDTSRVITANAATPEGTPAVVTVTAGGQEYILNITVTEPGTDPAPTLGFTVGGAAYTGSADAPQTLHLTGDDGLQQATFALAAVNAAQGVTYTFTLEGTPTNASISESTTLTVTAPGAVTVVANPSEGEPTNLYFNVVKGAVTQKPVVEAPTTEGTNVTANAPQVTGTAGDTVNVTLDTATNLDNAVTGVSTPDTTVTVNVPVADDVTVGELNVPASLFTAAAGNQNVANLTVAVTDTQGNEVYSWNFDADALKGVNSDTDLAVTATPAAAQANALNGVQIHGTVPATAQLTVPVRLDTLIPDAADYTVYTTDGTTYTRVPDANVALAAAGKAAAAETTLVTITGVTNGNYTVAPIVPAEVRASGGSRQVVVTNAVAGITYILLDDTEAEVESRSATTDGRLVFTGIAEGDNYTVQASYGEITGATSGGVTVSGGGGGGGSTIPGGGGGTTDPGEESNVKLDTQIVYMINEVSLYDFLVEGNNDTDNITVTSSNEAVATVALQDGADTRGAKYRVTTHGTGEATITVTYNGESATMDVVVYPKGGSITLDTVNYRMAPGNIYDIGVTVTDGAGNALSGEQVQQMYQNGTLRVTDSRTGSIVDLTQLPNGNFRVTGKNAGTCWITYEVIQDGVAVTHASVKVDVAAGVTQGGVATRDTSWWADKSADTTTQA